MVEEIAITCAVARRGKWTGQRVIVADFRRVQVKRVSRQGTMKVSTTSTSPVCINLTTLKTVERIKGIGVALKNFVIQKAASTKYYVSLNLLPCRLDILCTAGDFKYGLLFTRRRHNVCICSLLNSFDCSAFRADNKPHDTVGHTNLNRSLSWPASRRRWTRV